MRRRRGEELREKDREGQRRELEHARSFTTDLIIHNGSTIHNVIITDLLHLIFESGGDDGEREVEAEECADEHEKGVVDHA